MSAKSNLEIVADFHVGPVPVVVASEEAIGRPGKDVHAEAEHRVLRGHPVEPWPDHSSGVLEILNPQKLRLERARQLRRYEQTCAEPVGLERQISRPAEENALKALN